jgi:hypothetical protein
MANLFSSSEYVHKYCVGGMMKRRECSSNLENFRATSCGGTLRTWYIRSQLTTEVLRKRVENAATTIRNNSWKEWRNHFVGALIILLTITAVTLNTSCNG